MRKIIRKFTLTKSNSIITSLLSLIALLAVDFPEYCIFWFYEPERPEGINDINLKDLLPKKN